MLCFLVRGRRLGGAIGFHQHEARRVILLLGDIEPGDARLLDALPRIGEVACLKASTYSGFT